MSDVIPKTFFAAILLATTTGWVMNIYKLAMLSPVISEWGGMEVMRAAGIFFAPLGSVLGYL